MTNDPLDSMRQLDPPDSMRQLDPREYIWGEHKDVIEQRLKTLDPNLEQYVREFAYGTIYARGVLEPKTQEMLAIAMLCALGNPSELKTHLRGALNNGASELEVRETLLFAIPYLGFPRVIGAFAVLQEVLDKQEKRNKQP